MEEKEIGEVFEFEGIKLQVQIENISQISCYGCYFDDKPIACLSMKCLEFEREDGEKLIFKEIKDYK